VEFKRRKKKDIPRIGHVSAISYLVLTYDNENRASKRRRQEREKESQRAGKGKEEADGEREGGMAG